MLLNLFILTSVVSSQVMTFACAQKFATEFAAGTPSVATCLSSNGGTNFPLRCGAGCLNTLNTFPSRISSDCSGQILLNLGNGSEIRVNTMDKFFDAMTAVTCQVAPFGSQRTFCLEQIADDIINEPDYVATGLVCSSCSRRLVTAIKKWGPLIPFLSTSISEVLKLYDNVCTPSDRFLTVSQPYSEECSNSITNETALDAIRNSCAAPMTLIADSETYTLTNTGLETICDVPCTSKTKEYTEEVVNSCANSSFSVLGYNTAASDISTTMDNLKSVMCLKNGPDFCINGYLQSLITKIVLTVFGTVGLNVPIFSNSTELCTSCVRDEVALMESFEGDSFQSSLGSTLSETSKLINQTCVNTDFEFPTSLDACLDSIGDTSTLSNACTGNVAALSTDSLNPALMDRVCSTDCSDAITDYDLALGTDCTGGNNPSLTQVLGDSVRGTIQNVTNVLCTSQNSQYCLLNILNSVFTQFLNTAGGLYLTPTSCADCSTALQANLKSTTLDDAGNLQSFIKNSAAFCQRQPTSITLDGLSRPCHDSFVAAAAQVQDACFSNFNGNLFNSEVLDKVCKLACGAAYTKFTSTIQDTCASAVFGTIVLDDNPVDITLNVMFGMFSSFTNFACLKDGTDYCINSIPNRIASSGLNVFYDSNEFKVLSCSKCSEATRTLLRIKESVFAQSPGNSIIRDLVREWDGYCTVSQGSTATSTARPLPTVPSSSKRTGVTSTLVVAIICVFLFVI